MHPPEPHIVINGQELTEAQAMTVRVALQVFAVSVGEDPRYGETGRNYLARITEINRLMAAKPDGPRSLSKMIPHGW
jgi:hypothetical protein